MCKISRNGEEKINHRTDTGTGTINLHLSPELDPDPHSSKILDPDQHIPVMSADPKRWVKLSVFIKSIFSNSKLFILHSLQLAAVQMSLLFPETS
jgi:hypothetical protein